MTTDITPTELTAVLDLVVREILEQTRTIAPPVNALQLAVRLGYRVAWDQAQANRGRIVQTAARGSATERVILLKPEPRHERRQWAIAHELGEGIAWRVFELLDQDPVTTRPQVREQIANWLAGRLLVPTPWLQRAASEYDMDLLLLKRRFSTASHELLARRLLDMESPLAITIFDQGSLILRQATGGRRAPPWSELEQQCWQQCCEEVRIVERHGSPRVRVWPIHEPNWLREIVLTEYSEE